MPVSAINGIRLYSESRGEGAPVVLVHGSWGDHHNWNAVVPGLARNFRVLTYDRRGHSLSDRLAMPGNVDDDVTDLADLIRSQGLQRAHVVGNSFGALIVLKLLAERPDVVASLTVHEPPLIGLLERPRESSVRPQRNRRGDSRRPSRGESGAGVGSQV